jgi:hypothetical protein
MEIKTMDLSFCNTKALNVVNTEAKQFIMNKLKHHDIKLDAKRAYILHNKTLQYIEKTQHIISVKSSGTNYYLFFTNINNTNYCFYIDRKIKAGYTYPRIISVKYRFDDIVFNDTLIDGELIKNETNSSQWMFLITDIILYNCEKLNCNIINRFNLLYSILKNNYIEDTNLDICPLVVKKLFLYSQYDILITQFIPSLPYKTKGLYFNSLNTKHANQLYLFNNNNNNTSNNNTSNTTTSNTTTNNTTTNNNNNNTSTGNNTSGNNTSGNNNIEQQYIFKIKTTPTPEIYELYCKNNRETEKYGLACIPNMRTKTLVEKSLKNNEFIFMNCILNTKFNKYQPISIYDNTEPENLIDISKL